MTNSADPRTTVEHLLVMETKMKAIAVTLEDLDEYWIVNNLPGDFLERNEYPFHLSLDELAANIAAAVDAIAHRAQSST